MESDRHDGGEVDADRYPSLPPGLYRVRFSHWQTLLLFQRAAKVVLWFVIMEEGPHWGKAIARFYNCTRIIGRPSKNGRFKVGRRSKLVKDFCRLYPDRIGRMDRIPMSAFGTQELLAEVRTVESDFEQATMPEALRYSVIERLLPL